MVKLVSNILVNTLQIAISWPRIWAKVVFESMYATSTRIVAKFLFNLS
jgi:hypothetical protein